MHKTKKIIVVMLLLTSILMVQHSPQAAEIENTKIENPGIETILFNQNIENSIHGFAIKELGYTLIKLHTLAAGKDVTTINYQGKELEIIKKTEELTKTDVIQLLDLAPQKQEALSIYLTECYENLNKGNAISSYMRQEMEIIKLEMDACITDKQISDKMYFEAMNMYDQNIMETSLEESIKYEKCASEKRIEYNAKASIMNKLIFYLGLLQKKYDVLFNKQEILAKNFEIFRDNILPDLNQINELLKQYNF